MRYVANKPWQLTSTDKNDRLIDNVQILVVPPETATTLEPDNVDIDIPGVELEDNV